MNDDRPKLNKILLRKDWDIIIIENKDRLTRFGFNYLNLLLKLAGKQIIVINNSNEDKQDLINDLVSIIYSFSARLYGLRKRKNKEDVIKFLEQ
jgi:predicted site-specific integrase-resolvase